MINDHTQNLAIAVAGSFIISGLGYMAGLAWGKSVEKLFRVPPNLRILRLGRTFFLGLPIFGLATIVSLDYENLRAWWGKSPYTVSLIFMLFLGIVPILLVRAMIKVWLTNGHRRDMSSGEQSQY